MTPLRDRIAAEHRRIWNTVWITCRCGWSNTEPPVADRDVFLAHIADVTERAVRDVIVAELTVQADRWSDSAARHRADSIAAVEGLATRTHMQTAHAFRNKASAMFDAIRTARGESST